MSWRKSIPENRRSQNGSNSYHDYSVRTSGNNDYICAHPRLDCRACTRASRSAQPQPTNSTPRRSSRMETQHDFAGSSRFAAPRSLFVLQRPWRFNMTQPKLPKLFKIYIDLNPWSPCWDHTIQIVVLVIPTEWWRGNASHFFLGPQGGIDHRSRIILWMFLGKIW